MMRRVTAILTVAAVALLGIAAYVTPASGEQGNERHPMYVKKVPAGYRDWKFISLAHPRQRHGN